ncbi:type VI secretion system baseplate subunit TssF [Pseudoduganella sp. UC29_106]|uniref:type VI secretion system baseplate subunit TssF n=1 Tax=Pseudoduganella sp. UC29_106 TaxID=3374553 RepID=UPI003757A7DB
MEQLLPWVERELREFRRNSSDFAGRYPRVAGQMGGNGRGAPDVMRDPHVDRLVQAVAVLHARIAHSLDRSSPLLDEALLGSLFPGLLRPFPPGAVFQLPFDAAAGTELQALAADGRRFRFRLCAGAPGARQQVAALDWRPYAGPGQVHLLSLTIEGCIDAERLRLYVHAEPVLRAAFQDAVLMRASQAWVPTCRGTLEALREVPLRVAGFGEAGEQGWQVLRAWQCFPERFNFLELDLGALRWHLSPVADHVTLHLAVPIRADSALARTLARVEASNLLTGCAPAVNEFSAAAAPIDVTGRIIEYGLSPADPAHVICSIDSVHLLRGRSLSALSPPAALRFGLPPSGAPAAAAGWTARRALHGELGAPMRITFAAEGGPSAFAPGDDRRGAAAGSEAVTASVGLTCCDRVVPAGIVAVEPQGALVSAVSKLREVEGGKSLRWRLLAMLALEARPPDLESLRLALLLQDLSGSEAADKLQEALVDVKTARATLALRHKHGTARIDGTEVRVTLDERALVGTSVAVFAHVIDQYLSHSVHLNTFMQLVVISAETGEELMRCRPRNGNLML